MTMTHRLRGGGGVVVAAALRRGAAVSVSAFKNICDTVSKFIYIYITTPLIMSDVFQKDFAAAMMQSGMLQLACQCGFSNMTPAIRKAHLVDWHSKQVAELENCYLTSKYGFMLVFVLLSLSKIFHLSGTLFTTSISSHT